MDGRATVKSRELALLVPKKMQDGEVELPRVLQKREMACIRQDQQPRVRDRRGDRIGVLAFYRLVMIAVNDEDRRVDRLQLRVAPVRLLRPHRADLRDKRIILLWRRRLLFI